VAGAIIRLSTSWLRVAIVAGLTEGPGLRGSESAETVSFILASLLLTADTGLADVLLPQFQQRGGLRLMGMALCRYEEPAFLMGLQCLRSMSVFSKTRPSL